MNWRSLAAAVGLMLLATSGARGAPPRKTAPSRASKPSPSAQSFTPAQQQQLARVKELRAEEKALYQAGRYREAIPISREIVKLKQAVYGELSAEVAGSLNNLGILLQEVDDLAAARTTHEKALRIRKKVLGPDHTDTAQSLNCLGGVLKAQGQFAAAKRHYEDGLRIVRKAGGEDSRELIPLLSNLGSVLRSQADYAGARVHYEEALKITRATRGDDHLDTAKVLNAIGSLQILEGDYVAALASINESITIRKRALGDNHPDIAAALGARGQVLALRGDYQAARVDLEKALQISRGANKAGSETASALDALGDIAKAEGDYGAARGYYEQTLEIRKTLFGPNHVLVGSSLQSLGWLLQSQGDSPAAQKCFEESLRISRKAHGAKHPDTAAALSALGYVLLLRKDFQAARPYYEEALQIQREVFGDHHHRTGTALHNLALLLSSLGDSAGAQRHYEQALQIERKVHGENGLSTAATLNGLALVLRERADYPAARAHFEQAVAIRRKALGDAHPLTGDSLSKLSELEILTGDRKSAFLHTDQARKGIREHVARVLPSLSEREQLMFLDRNHEADFHASLTLGVRHSRNPDEASLSAAWLLNGKSIAQESLVTKTLLMRDASDSATRQAVADLLTTRQQLSALALSVPEASQASARAKTLERLKSQEELLTRKVAAAKLTTQTGSDWVPTDDVRKALKPGEVFIDFACFALFNNQPPSSGKRWLPDHYAAWVIPAPGAGNVQVIDLGPAAPIEQAVQAARESIDAAGKAAGPVQKAGEPSAEKETVAALQRVSDLVWKPLQELVGQNTRRLILSPDGGLWLVPWAALPGHQNRYLVEDYALQYVVSGRDLVRTSASTRSAEAALFGDPDFDLAPEGVLAEMQRLKLTGGTGPSAKHGLPPAPPLPWTGAEIQSILPSVQALTSGTPTTCLGAQALEAAVKAVRSPSVLVLSTHGYFLSDRERSLDETPNPLVDSSSGAPVPDGTNLENPLLRCGLLLAGCNVRQSSAGDEGVLTGLEITGIDLRGTDLVVLSACETGLGEIRNGEGVAGLRQAFQLAGAKSVVATLWQVPDAESARLMRDFFAEMAAGKSRPDALRVAQLKRINSRREKYAAAHPYFWAAYTLTGR